MAPRFAGAFSRPTDPYVLFRKSFRYSKQTRDRIILEQESPTTTCSLNRGVAMQDAQMLLFTGIFFALAFLYVKACQKLR